MELSSSLPGPRPAARRAVLPAVARPGGVSRRWSWLWLAWCLAAGLATEAAAQTPLPVYRASSPAPAGYVEVDGVEADSFNPRPWQANRLNFVPDQRFPLLAPLAGTFTNIYAPSAVEIDNGYRFFYGGWDGVPTANDRVYSAWTDPYFQQFTERHTVLLRGSFVHVNNASAVGLDGGAFAMHATVYPVNNLNKPGFFLSDATGTNWNHGSGEPYTVQATNLISLAGYSYAGADINGMNVLLYEDGAYRLYFADFQNFTGIYRASSSNGLSYVLDSRVYAGGHCVNDVKTFPVGGVRYYLMGMHENAAHLWFSVSTNGLGFPSASVLFTNLGDADRYIVALGWIVRGAPTSPARQLLGVVYGAGPVATLDRNSIFARWLQKRVVFEADNGTNYPGTTAWGPDRQLLALPATTNLAGRFAVYAEDGVTLLGRTAPLTVTVGDTCRLFTAPAERITNLFNTGVAADGTLLPASTVDPHYTLAASPDTRYPGPAATTIQPGFPVGSWMAEGPDSRWLAPRADAGTGDAPGQYIYRTRCDVSWADPGTAAIAGQFAVDDSLTDVQLNGHSLGIGGAGFGAFTTFAIPAGCPDFVRGVNTLDFLVVNGLTYDNPTGFRAELTGTARPPPGLAVDLGETQCVLSWPSASIGYRLVVSDRLPATNWVTVTGDVTIKNGLTLATVPVGPGSRYFRLIK